MSKTYYDYAEVDWEQKYLDLDTGVRMAYYECGPKDGKTVLLIFNRTCTDRNVGEQVFYISPVFRVKHFVCTGETAFFNGTDVHFAHGDQSLNHVRRFFRILDAGLSASGIKDLHLG